MTTRHKDDLLLEDQMMKQGTLTKMGSNNEKYFSKRHSRQNFI